MGAGKTRIALEIYRRLRRDLGKEPVIIICRVNAQPTWIRQIQEWIGDIVSPEQVMVAQGKTPTERADIWQGRHWYKFIITTPKGFVEDGKKGWIPKDMDLFLDEPHRYMKNRKNVTCEHLFKWTNHSDILLPISGTFIKRTPADFWPILHLTNRKFFRSYWAFAKTWCHVIDSGMGMEIVAPRNTENFKEEILAKHCIWITDKEVAEYLPKGKRIKIPVQPDEEQQSLMQQVINDMQLEMADGRLLLTPSALTQFIRLRQLLCCPKILNPNWGYGACLEEIVERLAETDILRPVIFTPFTAAIPYIVERLCKPGTLEDYGIVWTLQGGMKADELTKTLDEFNSSTNDIMICSISFAESFEFPRSSEAYFCAFDWSWVNNEQAEARLARLISEERNPMFFYPVHYGFIDERVWDVLNQDMYNVKQVSPQDLSEMFASLRKK